TAPQLQNTCGYNQTCSNGSCSQQNNLSVSISSYPNSPQINQSVIFSSSVTGGTGNYIYSWTGACAGYSTNCITSFSQSGTYTAYLSVSSGNQTQNASHAITVGQNCTANATQRCIGNSIYWYDSCGNQQGLIQTCNYNQTCSNGYCSNTQQNYITVQTNPATNTYNNQATLNGYVSGINTNNTNYVWFQWGTTTSYGFETNHQTLNYAGFFNQNIAGLSPLVVYHFRAVGQNYNGQIVYGRDLTFQLGQVLGATDISTGFTNNLLVDSFFLPLIIALALIWLFKSRVLNFTHWTDSGKIKHKDYVASKELKLKIAKIKEKEKLK
ncbi:MAG: PKD domain-containing protein, partial [Candidatus Staskawiczbacteria bacterium]|nr:PKD domain-containing protein [Candidatus Staskawiczbacteria bacterium]